MIARLIALLAVLQAPGLAAPILFTSIGSGSGSIGATDFAAAGFRIRATGNTNDRQPISGGFSEGFTIEHLQAEIEIASLGVFEFTSGTRTFVNQTLELVGFSRAGVSRSDLYNGPQDGVFANWEMLVSIGPIRGGGRLLQWDLDPVQTSGGRLFFDDGIVVKTFTAQVVPEPSTALLVLSGAALWGMLWGMLRRRRVRRR